MFSGLEALRPLGKLSALGDPGLFVSLDNRLSSRNTLTSSKCRMKVIEEARNLVKSNGCGIGVGSRSSI